MSRHLVVCEIQMWVCKATVLGILAYVQPNISRDIFAEVARLLGANACI